MSKDVREHGWVRLGECNRCGLCCIGCAHNFIDAQGLPACDVYGVKGSAHDNGCNVWPSRPIEAMSHAKCSYFFIDPEPLREHELLIRRRR